MALRISIVCTSPQHPVRSWLERWRNERGSLHQIELVERAEQLSGGDVLFLVSCHDVIGPNVRQQYRASLVLHASDLPEGRGWSPHIWQIVEGRSEIVLSLLEATEPVDCGAIWAQQRIRFEGHELHDEINDAIFRAELNLMDHAVDNISNIIPRPQAECAATFYRKRTLEDSRIDPLKSIAEQFDALRVADPERYPAFFDFRGKCYKLKLEKVEGA